MAEKVALLLWARLVLQVPARALLEGDTVTLRCRSWQNNPVNWVSFYREEKQLQRFRGSSELSLSPLWLHHIGCYRCRGLVYAVVSCPFAPSLRSPNGPQVPPSLSLSNHCFQEFSHTTLHVSPPSILPPFLGPLSLTEFPSYCPSFSFSSCVASRRGPALRGVRVGAAPRGTGGTGGPPGAELRRGRGDRPPVCSVRGQCHPPYDPPRAGEQ
ncbi:PREDICTED: Fc receptor-like A [Corvus brachyrhynchos]|uniref:Fc receptor-like A n=1 Tax=Corvus brachyrhynchos TaxID=85066 RepID=UPI000816614A|nr:PREDICTED: Fc receptor-like A [Corvus brachyrhynchos]